MEQSQRLTSGRGAPGCAHECACVLLHTCVPVCWRKNTSPAGQGRGCGPHRQGLEVQTLLEGLGRKVSSTKALPTQGAGAPVWRPGLRGGGVRRFLPRLPSRTPRVQSSTLHGSGMSRLRQDQTQTRVVQEAEAQRPQKDTPHQPRGGPASDQLCRSAYCPLRS